MRSRACRLLLLFFALPVIARAQSVRGRVVNSATRTPVASSLVELRDSLGRSAAAGFTAPSGAFVLLAPAPGSYVLSVKAIGFRPRPPQTIVVPADGLVLGDLELVKVTFKLPDLVAIGQAKSCGTKRILADDIFGRLLSTASNALDIMSHTISNHLATFTAETETTAMSEGRLTSNTVRQVLPRWPLESVDPEVLRLNGFGKVAPFVREPMVLMELDGPDATVLFANWFLETHCFALQKVKAKADTLKINFTPAEKGDLIDVSGEFDLDAHTFALLRMTFQGENVPKTIDKKATGGEIRFAALPSGLWIPTSWTIWAPVQGTAACGYRVMGLVEKRGILLFLTTPDPNGSGTVTTPVAAKQIPRQTKWDHEVCRTLGG